MKSTVVAAHQSLDRAAATHAAGGCVGRCHAVAAAWLLCVVTAVAAEQSAPLPATVPVLADHTYLRSGPGDDFYPTERLGAGTPVEVWATDPGGSGYVAVRPVAGSFSWLRACDVDTAVATGDLPAGDRGIGVIVTDGAVSRVGSQLNDLRHVAQVTLEAGERVRVLEEVRIASGRHAGLWVRIEPPAGEFRWARLADLETPPGLVVATPATAVETAEVAAARASLGEAVSALKDASVALAQAVSDGGTAAPAQPMPTAMPGQPSAVGIAPPQELGFLPTARRIFTGWLPRGTSVFDPAAPIAPVAVTAVGPSLNHFVGF